VSSHVLSEVEQTVDSVVIIARGRLVHEGTLDQLKAASTVSASVIVATPTPDKLIAALTQPAVTVTPGADGTLQVNGATSAEVGHAAWQAGVELHELREAASNLERVFLELTEDQPAIASGAFAAPTPPPPSGSNG
jgi:ABC-2 type transport system ATP-binding protein